MTVAWGGSVFNPQPDSYEITYRFLGSAARMADGTLRVDRIGEKARIVMYWTGLTYSQLQAIRTIYNAKAASENQLSLFDGRTFNVIAAHEGWREGKTIPISASSLLYELTLTFEEV